MHTPSLKQKAVGLRRHGLSYSEILKRIPVAKSTLSLWLREVGLSKEQAQRVTERKLAAMRRGWETVRSRRIEKSRRIREEARNEVRQLIHDPLWLAGTLLYWAEGRKERTWRTGELVGLSNMDCNVHKIFLRWLSQYIGMKKADLVFELYIHENGNIERAKTYWSQQMKIPTKDFKVYLKKHKLSPYRKNVNEQYFGLLSIRVRRSIDLNRKIAGWIEGVVKYL